MAYYILNNLKAAVCKNCCAKCHLFMMVDIIESDEQQQQDQEQEEQKEEM